MVNKQVNICDNCKKRTSDKKCCLCGKDLCPHCRRPSFDIIIRDTSMTQLLGEVVFCKECKHKLIKNGTDNLFEDFDEQELSKSVQNYLIKKMTAENL